MFLLVNLVFSFSLRVDARFVRTGHSGLDRDPRPLAVAAPRALRTAFREATPAFRGVFAAKRRVGHAGRAPPASPSAPACAPDAVTRGFSVRLRRAPPGASRRRPQGVPYPRKAGGIGRVSWLRRAEAPLCVSAWAAPAPRGPAPHPRPGGTPPVGGAQEEAIKAVNTFWPGAKSEQPNFQGIFMVFELR